MKRYWKSISIVTIMVLVIGTFYIQSSFATSKYPEFVFKKISGNEEELDGLTIFADYSEGAIYNDLEITNQGTTFFNDLSLFERLAGPHRSADIKRYQKDYRNFMRGKQASTHLFYEDSSTLTYAGIKWEGYTYEPTSEFSFEIDVLDKQSNENTSFNLEVPKSNRYSHVSVEDVQVKDGQLKVVTRNYPRHEKEEEVNEVEIHVYSFSPQTKELQSDEMVVAVPWQEDGNGWTELTTLHESYNVKPEKYLMFKIVTVVENGLGKDENVNTNSEVAETSEFPRGMSATGSTLYAYNYETNKTEEISLPEELQNLVDTTTITTQDESIYFTNFAEEGMEVTSYNVESKQVESKQTFDLETTGGMQPFVKIENDKMYIVTVHYEENDKDTTILIANVKTGEKLYEGSIEIKDPGGNQDQRLYVSEIVVVN